MVVAGAVVLPLGMKIGSKHPSQTDPTSVRIEAVQRGDLSEIVSAPGQVQPKTKVQISARVAARIVELQYDEGDIVTKGNPGAGPPIPASVLVRMDATEMEAQLRAAEARAAAQKAQIAEAESRIRAQESQIEASRVMQADAKRDLRRQAELLASKDVSQATVDQAQAKADQLDKQIESSVRSIEADKLNLVVLRHQQEAAEAEIARAKDNLSYTTITSPIDGIITRLNAKMGEMVVTGTMNNPGTVIMEISDLSQMQVDTQIDESNIASVKEGQKAKVRISAYPDDVFDGTVKLVGLDTATAQGGGGGGGGWGGGGSSSGGKWYRARVVLETKGKRIPAGLSADVDIETEVHKNVIKVPTQAVLGRNVDDLPAEAREKPEVDKTKTLATVVYLVKDGKTAVTPVTIGASDMTHTMIIAGLKEGDQVIVGPYKALPGMGDGQKVKMMEPTTKATTGPATKASKN
jgi:HlyD family secretion protein